MPTQTITSIHNRQKRKISYAPEVRVTTFVVVFVVVRVGVGLTVGIVALVTPPDTPLGFFNTLFSALLSLFPPPPLESVPRVSSPPPFLREGSVRLRVTPTVVGL